MISCFLAVRPVRRPLLCPADGPARAHDDHPLGAVLRPCNLLAIALWASTSRRSSRRSSTVRCSSAGALIRDGEVRAVGRRPANDRRSVERRPNFDRTDRGSSVRASPFSFRRIDRRPLAAGVRRFLDLQAGSIWGDLAVLLPQVAALSWMSAAVPSPIGSLFSRGDLSGIDMRGTNGTSAIPCRTRSITRAIMADSFGSVDVVLCTEALEHVPEPAVFLAEAYRCLKPGGRLLLTVPFAARWHFIPHDYWRFTPSGLQRQLSAAGFTSRRLRERNALTVAATRSWPCYCRCSCLNGRARSYDCRCSPAAPALPFVLALGAIGTLS